MLHSSSTECTSHGLRGHLLSWTRSIGANVLDGLGKIGLTDEQARKVVVLTFSGNKQSYGVDISTEGVEVH